MKAHIIIVKNIIKFCISFFLGFAVAIYCANSYWESKVPKETLGRQYSDKKISVEEKNVQAVDTFKTPSFIKVEDKADIRPVDTSLYIPDDGIISNETTAIQVALPILISIYGNDIMKEMPVRITLTKRGTWLLRGSRRKFQFGGTFCIEIDKKSGKIISLSHGK